MSGKPDFDVGDVVVCVAGNCGAACHAGDKPSELVEGRAYRVAGLVPPELYHGDCVFGVHLVEMPPRSARDGGYCAARFRKVRPASDEFTRQMRSLRPIKAREDA